MKNRIFVMITAALLVLAVMPVASLQVFAGASKSDAPVFVQGIKVTADNDDVLGDGGSVKYDADTYTLTLNNAKISIAACDDAPIPMDSAIYRDGPLNLKLIGSNTIINDTEKRQVLFAGVYAFGHSLNISGEGSLAIDIRSNAYNQPYIEAIMVESAVISSKLDITIDIPEASYAFGISTDHLVTNAPVSVSVAASRQACGFSFGGYTGRNIALNAAVDITVRGKEKAYGIDSFRSWDGVDRLAINNSIVRITTNDDASTTSLGISNFDSLSINGDSELSVSARQALSGVESVDVDKDASLEATGSGQAFASSHLSDKTKALGAMIKSSLDGEYSRWDGSSDLNTQEIKGIRVPGEDANTTVNNNAAYSVNINRNTLTAAYGEEAVAGAGGSSVTRIVLGKSVKKIGKKAFAGTNVNTLVVTSKKLTKKSVKGSLKGSKITKIQVKVGSKKVNKKYVKKYKKIFTKKNAGKKVKVV